MNDSQFDRALRHWTCGRRSVFSLGVGLLAALAGGEVVGAKKRKGKKKKGNNKKNPKRCASQPVSQTCNGKCGSISDNCGAVVECTCPRGQCCNGQGACDACLVFRTSKGYRSNLQGLTGADQLCRELAATAGLPGTYLAWLSDSTGSPSSRFVRATVPYTLVNGTVIANNWADLTDGTITSPITVTETGGFNDKQVWTNTRANGTPGSDRMYTTTAPDGEHCFNWTYDNSFYNTYLGFPFSLDANWTDFETRPCHEDFGSVPAPWGLYCFQQR